MKMVSGKIVSSTPISLTKAAKVLSKFAATDNGASQAVGAYLRRASASFNELSRLHKELEKSSEREGKKQKIPKPEMSREDAVESGRKPSPSPTSRGADRPSQKRIGVNSVRDGERDEHKKKRKMVKGEVCSVGDGEVHNDIDDREKPNHIEMSQRQDQRTNVKEKVDEIGRILSFVENGALVKHDVEEDKRRVLKANEGKKKKERVEMVDRKKDNFAEQRSMKKRR